MCNARNCGFAQFLQVHCRHVQLRVLVAAPQYLGLAVARMLHRSRLQGSSNVTTELACFANDVQPLTLQHKTVQLASLPPPSALHEHGVSQDAGGSGLCPLSGRGGERQSARSPA